MPSRFIKHSLPDNPGLPEILLQHDAIAFRILLQRSDQAAGMGHHPDLAMVGRANDQSRQRRQKIGVQAGFRFVENHHGWRARGQQRGDQQQISQRAVRQCGSRERPQQPLLIKLQREQPAALRVESLF